jgi:GT2 family glycosyltransferase
VNTQANIIVVGYGCTLKVQKLEVRCFQSIIMNTKYPYMLTYIDNYQSGLTLTEAWNKLIGSSTCEYIVLLNNDTEVTEDWLTRMISVFDNYPKCGFVGPSTNACHSPQKTINTPENAREYNNSVKRLYDPMSGFCLVFRKSIWEELGGFDKRFIHYGQESDLCDRAHKLGYESYWCQGVFVHHVSEASVKASGMDIEAARQEAKNIYWSERKK